MEQGPQCAPRCCGCVNLEAMLLHSRKPAFKLAIAERRHAQRTYCGNRCISKGADCVMQHRHNDDGQDT